MIKEIMNVGVAAQAAGLAGHNMKFATKKNIKSKDLIKTGVGNIVGVNLIKAQSDIIAKL